MRKSNEIETIQQDRNLRVILYVRVSTRDQDLGLQKDKLSDYCKLRGWEPVRLFEDKASGKDTDRPGFKDMLKAITMGDIDAIVIYKLDRIGRSLRDLLHILEHLKENGIALVSLTDSIDTTSAQGRLFFNITAAFAEYERELIKDRCDSGKERAREQGVRFGRPPKEIDMRDVMRQILDGIPKSEIARKVKVCRRTLYLKIDEFNKKEYPRSKQNQPRDG